MIEIRVTDPYATPAPQLRALASFLSAIADNKPSATPAAAAHPQLAPSSVGAIAPDDNPAAGTNPAEVFEGGARPDEVFAGNADPAVVFGGTPGNVPAAPVQTANDSGNAAAPALYMDPAPVPPPVELDKNGLPWDARIHSESRNKNKDGSWRNKRGVAPEAVTQVEAELRAVVGNAAPAAPIAATATAPAISTATPTSALAAVPPPPPVVGAVTLTPAAPNTATANPGNVPPPPPPASTAPAASTVAPIASAASPATGSPVESAPAPSISFPLLCSKITTALNGGTLTQARLGEVLAAHKLQGLPTLAAFPNLVQPVAAALGFA